METTDGGACPSCGARLPVDARWCGRCGTHQREVSSEADRDSDVAPVTRPGLHADPPGTATPLGTTPRQRTAVAERIGWFMAGLLAAGVIALAVAPIASPTDPSMATPPSGQAADGDVADGEPGPLRGALRDDAPSEPDQDLEPATDGTDTRQDQHLRDSLATCRTVDGEPCGPAYDLDVATISEIRVVGDHLLGLDAAGRIHSLSIETGEQRWRRPTGMTSPEVHLSVAEDRDRFIIWSPTTVQARDLEDGEVAWEVAQADAATTGTIRPFDSVHLLDDAVILLGSRSVTVLDVVTGSTNHQVKIGDGLVRLLPDGFAIAEGDQVRRWGTIDPTPRWVASITDRGELRFVDEPPTDQAAVSGAPLAVEGSATGDIVVLGADDGDRLLELPGSQHHDIQRLDELLVNVTWAEPDSAMAHIVGARRGDATDALTVSLPCCGVSILPGPDDFVAVAAPRVGSHAVLVDVKRGVRLDLVRPDEIVGQRTPTALTATLAMWRSPTGQVGADQLTGRIHWRASAGAVPVSTHPLILAGERSIVRVMAPFGDDR